MKLFTDKKSEVYYELCSAIPPITKSSRRLIAHMLTLYSIYRNGLYETRIKRTLDPDIARFSSKFNYEYKNKENTANNSLYQYSSYIGLDAMQELFQHQGQCCVAFRTSGLNRKIAVGFLVFYEKEINNKKMVYISHVSVNERHKGIGTKLIQNVLNQYPADTLFYLCARVSNAEGLNCYSKLGFEYDHSHVKEFGYNLEYFIGMSHTTTEEELIRIKENFDIEVAKNKQTYFSAT